MKYFFTLMIVLFLGFEGFSQLIDLTAYDKFLKEHVSNKGVVDYDKVLKNIDELNAITSSFSKISPNKGWSNSEVKAYWINFYNASIIKILSSHYPIKSIDYVKNAFKEKQIDYAGSKISLDIIEHQHLRVLEDPRVHFALYSTAISSPKLSKTAYQPHTIEKELGIATSNFINDITKNKIKTKFSKISKVFDWYKDDFNLITFINQHSGGEKIDSNTIINYMDYDWNLFIK